MKTILIAAAALAQASAPGTLDLVCTGTATKDERVGTTFDFLSGTARTERIGATDSVRFELHPDNTGTARLPHRLYAYAEPNPDGSFPLLGVVRGQDEITGRVRLHANYKPSFRLDRITGVVTLTGDLGEFSCRCDRYDPTTVQRKF
jgi:hypothetical protein